MKAITENGTNLSKYIFEDGVSVTISADNIVTPSFVINDLNSSNATMHENVTPPDDWAGNKYTFDGTTWTANPNWVEPTDPYEGDI